MINADTNFNGTEKRQSNGRDRHMMDMRVGAPVVRGSASDLNHTFKVSLNSSGNIVVSFGYRKVIGKTAWVAYPTDLSDTTFTWINDGVVYMRRLYPTSSADGAWGELLYSATPPDDYTIAHTKRIATTYLASGVKTIRTEHHGNIEVIDIRPCAT